jgi:hypothetical protein
VKNTFVLLTLIESKTVTLAVPRADEMYRVIVKPESEMTPT